MRTVVPITANTIADIRRVDIPTFIRFDQHDAGFIPCFSFEEGGCSGVPLPFPIDGLF